MGRSRPRSGGDATRGRSADESAPRQATRFSDPTPTRPAEPPVTNRARAAPPQPTEYYYKAVLLRTVLAQSRNVSQVLSCTQHDLQDVCIIRVVMYHDWRLRHCQNSNETMTMFRCCNQYSVQCTVYSVSYVVLMLENLATCKLHGAPAGGTGSSATDQEQDHRPHAVHPHWHRENKAKSSVLGEL